MKTAPLAYLSPQALFPALPLATLQPQEIDALPVEQLHSAWQDLQAILATLKATADRVQASLDRRYAKAAQAVRQAAGKDFGTCHLNEGMLRITADLPKKVSWDQKQLAAIAERIEASGAEVTDYLDIEYGLPESRFTAWPPTLQAQFAPARTVKPGKASYRLEVVDGEV